MKKENVRKGVALVGLCVATVWLPSCTSPQWQADQLDRNIGHVTQEQIMNTFGKPDSVQKIANGEAVWIYQYRYTTIGGTAVVGKVRCWENVLLFDHAGILRDRERRDCSGKSPS